MLARAILIWLLFLVIAIGAAGLRESLLTPRVGEQTAHVLGTAVVVALLALVIGLTVRWVVPTLGSRGLLLVGTFWTGLTVLFEFGFGRFVVGHSWSRLLHDYNLLAGRVWIFVLLTTLLAPLLLGRLQAGGQ